MIALNHQERYTKLSDITPQEDVPVPTPSTEGYKALKTEEEAKKSGEAQVVEVRDREFKVTESLPGIILLNLGLASDPSATQGEQLRAVRQFLHAAIHPDEVDSFEVYLRSAQPAIEMEELNKIVEKLVTEVAGRPSE